MNNEQESISVANSIAKVLWPEFVVVDDHVFFRWAAPEKVDLARWHDRTEVEATLNHTHVLDLFAHRASLDAEPWWNQSHPDFKAACEFGLAWAEAISAKLAKDFPERRFRVYYTEQDNPVVRFHQEHAGEEPWLSPEGNQEELASGALVIHRVCGYNNSLQARRP